MSGPLLIAAATSTGTPAEAPATPPKGSPVDARGEAFDFAALLSAGVTAVVDERRSSLEGAAPSTGQAVPSGPGALPAPPGRAQRREDRDRGSPQIAASPMAMAVLAPVVLSPAWLSLGGAAIGPATPRQDAAQPHARAAASGAAPALAVASPPSNDVATPAPVGPAVTIQARDPAIPGTSVPATAPATAADTSSARATAAARSAAGAPWRAGQNAAEAAVPAGSPVPAPARSTTTTATAHATGSPAAIAVQTATAAPGAARAGSATPTEAWTRTSPATAFAARLSPVAPAEGSSTSRAPGLVSPPVASAAVPHARVSLAAEPSPGLGSKASSAGTPVSAGVREAPGPVLPAVDSAVASPVISSPPAAAALAADVDVAVADQALVAVVPLPTAVATEVDVVALAQPVIELISTAHEPATKAATVAPEPTATNAPTRSQGRVAIADAALVKNPGAPAPASVGQPVAPVAAHVAVPGRFARADHAPAGIGGAPAASGAVRSKIPDGAQASPDPASPTPNAQPTASSEVAPVGAAGPAKTVTVVTKASPAVAAPSVAAGARLRDALVSVANHAVLRGEATGQIDVPELGRIAVRAHSTGGTVDVAVTAEGQDARATLRGHLSAMTADLHAADVPVGRLTIDRAGAAFGDSLGSSMSSPDRGSGAGGDSPRDNRPQSDRDGPPAAVEAVVPRRVRIVL